MKTISDKGKANGLGKLLSTVQVLWLLVRCAARWKTNLPLTVLKVRVEIQGGHVCMLVEQAIHSR